MLTIGLQSCLFGWNHAWKMYFPSGDFSSYESLTDVVGGHGKHMTRYHDLPGWILLMCLFNPL